MEVLEVPFPALGEGQVLVRNHFSLISAGTEGTTVRDARRGYLAKARARQDEVRQVVESVRANGVVATYRRVMNRLEAPSALGYSCAGEVMAVGAGVRGLSEGDRVACGGASASHAEVVAVPRLLCARVPAGVPLQEAAFTTVAAIAMQGVRQAELELGATGVVIGLGLVGLLTMQLLEAAGVQALGIDVAEAAVAFSNEVGVGRAYARSAPGLEEAILEATGGLGADAVLITAGTSSLDPVDLAGRLCRQRGRVVVVGNVPTGFRRAPYYRKELDLRMSCSYGPGRYDPAYEVQGHDYPAGYVRWTEHRNMQACLALAARGRLALGRLVTHTFPLADAPAAYGLILERRAHYAGILLAYDVEASLPTRVAAAAAPPRPGEARVGFVGAGAFAQHALLPAVQRRATLVGVATARPHSARHVAERYGFRYGTGTAAEVLSDTAVDTVFIATRHDSHAGYVLEALAHGKHVFVEKPLCTHPEALGAIRAAYEEAGVHLMVGFNRRFAPHVRRLAGFFPEGVPRALHYRVNAGRVPPEHWIHDPAVGGGRIVGEVCHFVDLLAFLAGAPIVHVTADALADPHGLNDTLVVGLRFENGSVASLAYCSNGHKRLAKERLEVFAGGRTAVLDDFRRLTLYADKVTTHRLRRQDKGHDEEVARFLDAVRAGGPTPIPYDEIEQTMRATFAIEAALRRREAVPL